MNLLNIIQRAARKVGLSATITYAVGNTNQMVAELLECSINENEWLLTLADWQETRREWTHTTLAQETQTGAIPADFGHFIKGTLWNRSQQRRLNGPVTSDEWQKIKATSSTPIVDNIFLRGKTLLMSPVPSAGWSLAGEYASKSWCSTADGLTLQTTWTLDTDLPLFPESLIVCGTAMRYKRMKGLDITTDITDYKTLLDSAIAQNQAHVDINLACDQMEHGITVPEGSWNV